MAGVFVHQFKRKRLQRISREQRHRLAIDLVAGGNAASHVIVVHAGQIIVNQRVGVQALGCAGIEDRIIHRSTTRFRCCEAQDWSQTLAAGENTVPHRLVQRRGACFGARDETFERRIHELAALGEVFFEIRHEP